MKIALCLSGHVRNLVQNFPSLKQFILDPCQPDVFLSTWTTLGWRAEGNLITLGHGQFKGFDHYSQDINQEEVLDLLKPESWEVENFLNEEQKIIDQAKKHKPNCGHPLDRPENTISMAYKLFKCNELKKAHEQKIGAVYDLVIRSRPDMVYMSCPVDQNVLSYTDQDYLLTSQAHSYDMASDLFAIGKSPVMDSYSSLYHHLDEINDLGCNMNPHHVCKFYYDQTFPNKWLRYPFLVDLNRCRKECGPLKLWCEECNPSKQILSNLFSK